MFNRLFKRSERSDRLPALTIGTVGNRFGIFNDAGEILRTYSRERDAIRGLNRIFANA